MVEGFYTRLDDVFVLETPRNRCAGQYAGGKARNGSGAVVQGEYLKTGQFLNRQGRCN